MSKQIKFVKYLVVSSLKKDEIIQIIQSNCLYIFKKYILEKIKVLGFLSTTKPVENYLEHILFHVHLLLVSLYLSLEHLIQVFWIR